MQELPYSSHIPLSTVPLVREVVVQEDDTRNPQVKLAQ